MPRILAFTAGPQDWQSLLADPEKHWKSGFSARTLAHSWEAVDGFPEEVHASFAQCADPLLANLTPILAIPEFKVHLPGGTRASQNDVFCFGSIKCRTRVHHGRGQGQRVLRPHAGGLER
jgi:hypothetical protein